MAAFFYLLKLVSVIIKNIKSVVVLETYVTHDITSSNLLLVVLTLPYIGF